MQHFFANDIVGIIENDRERASAVAAVISKTRRRGRPPLKSEEAKRASFNTRLRNALREHLEESAEAAGRSLSEEIETRLERSLDRTESLGGVEYEALFQMMAAAARVVEARLGKSPFSDPEASAVARNAWRQIIYNLTPSPLEGEAVKEHFRIIQELTTHKPPTRPSLKLHGGIGEAVPLEQTSRELEKQLEQYQKEWARYETKMRKYQEILELSSRSLMELDAVANEAAGSGLSFPKHR